jgi:enoyl-CoA hydratase/carnithine racemase/FixJ family two-component response regulator
MNQPINIMVVDDELIVRESLYHRFLKYGHAVDTASSGDEALTKLGEVPFDLMFVDMKMPGMNGIELLEQVTLEYPDTIVVIITAYGSVESAVQAMRIGAADYLLKPFNTDQLEIAMEKALQKRKSLSQLNDMKKQAEKRVSFDSITEHFLAAYQTTDSVIRAKKTDQILLLTLNRPDNKNALNFTMLGALKEAFAACNQDPEIRVVIITGAGDRAFCAGEDLRELVKLSRGEVRFYNKMMDKFSFAENFKKPVITAINGMAYGAGAELALASDIRIAASNARLGLIQTRLAIIPGAGGTQRLPRLVGRGKAKELIYTGRIIKAQEALEIGLVNKVCEPERLIDEVLEIASLIVRNSPTAIEQAKYAINRGFEVDLKTGFDIETESYTRTVW